ncbi:uncharacterized protein A4U43_C01F22650 [Asparagus officinalis]|uniref:non-specific serine/threonine protein kinase n=1 Tax=Asparagus officinalis TaxID=4686 RepID=A0A5P1FRL8_ASPOF|nr:uncharacterized protein A4U43_C01F22650 [Asparagus officinalis]
MKLPSIHLLLIQLVLLQCFAAASQPSNATDKFTLLALKSSISGRLLASWNDSILYCQWIGVRCSEKHPGRVTAIDLVSLNLAGSITPSIANLTFLQSLNLANNNLIGRIPVEISSLHRLKYLNLSMNSLEGEIPHSISNLSSIRTISLKGNRLQGEIPSNLKSCLNLQILVLSNNQLNGEIPGELASIANLSYLDLGTNNLVGSIPPSLGNLSSLLAIDLSNNTLTGRIPSSFGQLSSLVFLYLNNNKLVGKILPLDNLTSTAYINLSYNNLTGGIPPSFGNLSSLISIDLTVNLLSASIPASLGNLPSLTSLSLTGNAFSGPIPSSIGCLPSLSFLALSHNQLSGKVPSSIYNSSILQHLGLADNQLADTLPSDLGQKLPALQSLILYYNGFHGLLPMSLANASGLSDIELTGNTFSGTIPSNLGNLQNLYWLNLDRNEFDARDIGGWSFLDSLVNCSELQALSLDYNGPKGLGGVMPKSVANLSTNLQWLALGGNKISGRIPEEIGNLASLTVLGMDENFLSGGIPASIGQIQSLQELYLSGNKLSGTIPSSLGNLTQLNKLLIGENALEGSIPPILGNCQALRLLNLSYNQITGTIPKEIISISSLTEFVDLTHNFLTGPLPPEVGQLRNLVQFYASENNLSGEIPGSIGECELLGTLYMDHNHFQGPIPSSVSNLKGIQKLDVSHNNMSGHIPKFLQDFRFLEYLNLSFNNFEGELPTKGIFRNLSAVSVLGNNGLCGGESELHLPVCSSRTVGRKGDSQRRNTIILVSVASLCSMLLVCLLVAWYFSNHIRKDAGQSSESMEEGNLMKITYSEILKATDGLCPENLIGVGSFGSVYKGIMNFGEDEFVAIKVLNLQHKGATKSFMAECNALRSVRHRNLVKILTLCSSVDSKGNDFKALVFEYMPKGNLDKWLHPEGEEDDLRILSLEQRLNIAIDVAFALDYLHHHGPVPIVHCDLKPSNILLDDDMTAHVADFGLAKILEKTVANKVQTSTGSIGMKGTIGYVAPGIMKIVDPYLFQGENQNIRVEAEECLVSVLRIGLLCSRQSSGERMQMGDVVNEMQAARETFVGIGNHRKTGNKYNVKGESSSRCTL